MTGELPALRPPAWAEKYRWHWLTHHERDESFIFVWHTKAWTIDGRVWRPADLAKFGWSYSHPADPSARVIDPEDEAMVGYLSDVIKIEFSNSGILRRLSLLTNSAKPETIGLLQKMLAISLLTALKEMP